MTLMIPDGDPVADSDATSVKNDAENDNRHTMPEV
jgi:hypothetical protein